jgi:signal transduction histidine kinase/ActR/RegA family two-component response regulator
LFSGSRTQKEKQIKARKGVLQAAREGAERGAWIREAVEELLALEGVERAGAWLEETSPEPAVSETGTLFRGEVLDIDGGAVPAEWKRLSTESPLPAEVLNEKKSVEYETHWEKSGPIFGPLVGLARVLWIPVTAHGVFRGMLLAGTARKSSSLPRHAAERVALELEFLLEQEEERRAARDQQSDLLIWSQVQAQLLRKEPFRAVLQEIVRSCTNEGNAHGPGAVFAILGERMSGLPVPTPSAAALEERLEILAASGEPAWAYGTENGPLESLWRQAVQDRMLISAEADRLPLAKGISRIVAIPLKHDTQISGVLIAGIAHGQPHLEMIQRLELRAQLASLVLSQLRRDAMELRRASVENALFDLSGEPVSLVDRDGFLAGMSRGARVLTNEPEFSRDNERDCVRERRFAQLFRPRDWEEVDQWQKASFAGFGSTDDLFPDAQLRDGQRVRLRKLGTFQEQFVAVRFEPLQSDNRPRSLEEVEEEFRQVVAWMEEGVAVFDTHGGLRVHNIRFLQMLGVADKGSHELQTLEDLLHSARKNAANPEKFTSDWRALADGNNDGVKDELEMEWPIPQVLERCTKAIFGKQGQSLGRVEVYREMRGRNLFESRMAQTEQLASLGQRITSVVHELSNPLTSILLLAQRLSRRDPATIEQSDTQQILLESSRATAILRQMLDLAREHRRERKLVSLNQVVSQSVELQRAMLAGSRIALRVDLQENLPHVEGDFSQLQQVLLNLLQNAQQAIEESTQGSRVDVSTAHTRDGRVRLEIRDDGPGIPGYLQAKIFDPFFTTKPPGLGTGLGLSIVLGFVRQHGGTVSVDSQPGSGTRFVVELPAAAADASTRGAATERPFSRRWSDSPPVKTDAPSGLSALSNNLTTKGTSGGDLPQFAGGPHVQERKPKILVVEDEPTVGGLIADVLREEGMLVDVLADGGAALRQAETELYDLAICDLKMPEMDGQDFYRVLGERGNPLQEHVLFVTGDILASRSQKFLEQHRLAYVAKPFRMEELVRAVRRMLWARQQSLPAEVSLETKQAQGIG